MSFTLNAPGSNNNPYTNANLVIPRGTIQSDTTGWKRGSGTIPVAAQDTAFGSSITSRVTLSAIVSSDFVFVGSVVRTGANAGAFVGVYYNGSTEMRICRIDAAGTKTDISNALTVTALSANDTITCVYNTSTGAVTAQINGGSNLSFAGTTTDSTYAGESTIAAGFGFDPQNSNGTKVSVFFADGQAATDTTLTPSAASMTMTGSTPTVTTTGNQTLAPAAASLAMTGATPTVSAQAYTWYALPAPGAYDSNSILAGQTYPTGSWIRVVTDFAHITYDYAAAEAAGELDNDINDHAVADSGYTGSDSATFEIKTPAGSTAQYTVNVTIQETGITAGPSAATLTMTGATPTVTTGGNQTLSPAAAAMTMTGATPTITGTTTSVAPAAASMVMTGGVPSVSNGAPVSDGLPFSRLLSRGLSRRIHRSLNG